MAKNNDDVILNIEVRYKDAIKSIAEYSVRLQDAKEKQAELKEEFKKGEISQREYAEQMALTKVTIDKNKAAVSALEKEIENNIKAEHEEEGSLNALRGSLVNLTDQYNAMSEAERKGAAGEDLAIHINAITDELKAAEDAISHHRQSIGDYGTATRDLEAELSEITKKLAEMKLAGEDNTESYQELSKTAGELKSAINGVNEEVEKQARNTSVLEGLNQGLQTVVASYGLYKSALSAAGLENEELEQSMEKLTMVMAALQSLETIRNALSKESALMMQLNTVWTKSYAAATTVASGVMKLFGTSTTTTSTAFKVLRGAIISTGIGALIVLVGALIANWDNLVGWFKKGTDGMSGFGKVLDKTKEIAMGVWEAIKTYILTPFRTLGKIISGDFTGAIEEIKKGFDLVGNYQKGANQQMIKNQEEAAQRKMEARRKEASETLLNEAQTLEKKLALDRAMGKSTDELFQQEMNILERKKKAYRLALQNISDTNSEQYKDLKKMLEDIEQEMAVKDAEAIKRKQDLAQQAAQQAAQTAKERADKQRELLRQAEDTALALLKDGIEKQRQTITQSYTRQIEDLKRKLEQEKNLTPQARAAINQTILNLEQKQQNELQTLNDKYSDEQLQKTIETEQKRIEIKLAAVRAGSEEEHKLRLEQIEQNRIAETNANAQLAENLRQSQAAINAKYDKQTLDATKMRNKQALDEQAQALQTEWRERFLAVQQGSLEESALKVQQAQAELDALLALDEQQKAALYENENEYTNAVLELKEKFRDAEKANTDAVKQAEITQLQSAQAIGQGFEELLNSFAEDNETLAGFAKAIALFNLGLNTAEALSKGIAASQSIPFPGNLAAIAVTIATVMANIAKAKQLLTKEKQPKAPKLATGGAVTGPGTGTSDSIIANLSSGESVLNAPATAMFAPLLSALNQIGGGIPINVAETSQQIIGEEMLARAFARGVESLPAPVVSVEEINSVNTRVKTLENLSLQ
jgi:septal ring factor EnvC (AmiA/AmiB activator)